MNMTRTFTKGTFRKLPQTPLGWWAIRLSALFAVLFIAVSNNLLPFSGLLTMILGVIAGILTVAAIVWKGERSWLIWLMLLPGLFAIAFAAGEILLPH